MKRKALAVTAVGVLFMLSTSFRNTYSKGTIYVVIDKSDYELNVFDEDGWLATYPVVFGNKDQGDKLMEGDRRTPDGSFKIVNKRVHEKWNRFMAIDYPTAESLAKFNLRKQQGIVPPNASPGGAIGIHGTWPREDFAVDYYQNWTQGCISMKNKHVEEFYTMIPVGTKVTIRR